MGGENIVMTSGSRHKDAAWAFMKFMLSEKPRAFSQLPAKLGPALGHLPTGIPRQRLLPGLPEQLLTAKARTPTVQ